MARGATKQTAQRRQVSRTTSVPAPVGGLNAVDALAAMPPEDAIVLDNWFPQPSYISIRGGYSPWSTGYPGWVETILPYSNAAGDKLFGISGTAIYEATAGGAIGASVVSGLTNARWEYTNVATAGGQFLYAANGTDSPLLYNGTSWTSITAVSTPAITGVTTTKLRNPVVWKNRVWFVEEGSMRAWYLPTASVGGAAQSLDLGPLFRMGGKLHVIITASLTDGSTFDDYIAFVSTQGEILLYRGTDPATVGLFVLTGIYRIGPPVGRRCFFKMGEDCIIICADGIVSLTKAVAVGRVNSQETISYKIMNLINDDVASYSSHFGWEGCVHPIGNKMLINVPENENALQYQYVMNTIGWKWCRFTGWNAATFCAQSNTLYFGGSNYIAKADTGSSDNNNAINATMKTAFNYFGNDRQKFVKMVRPLIQTDGTLYPAIAVNMDFSDVPPTGTGTYVATLGSPWDTSPWDTSAWAAFPFVQKYWKTVYGVGFAVSLYIKLQSSNLTVNLQAIDYCWEPGGIL